MAMVSDFQYETPVNSRAKTRPMTMPVVPKKAPMPTKSAARRVRRKVVLMTLRSMTPSWCPIHLITVEESSVVVARVDVQAGDPLVAEHGHVAAVVLEGQDQVEPGLPQLPDRATLEL